MTTTRIAPYITPIHEKILAKAGIPLESAKAWGITSIRDDNDLARTDLDYHGGKGYTGLLFPLRMPDGATTYQLRLDDAFISKDQGKYVQASGRGAILNIPESRAHLVGKASKVLIVEGTKQTIVASLYAPDDYLVVGIQGCHNFSKNGVPLEGIAHLVPEDAEVTIIFDADWQTNPAVWEAARDLQSHLEITVGTKKPRLATIPGGGKLGLDDSIGSNPSVEKRPEALMRIIDSAKTALGRQPAKRKVARSHVAQMAGVVMDFDGGQIRDRAVEDVNGAVTPGELLADFAVRTTATWTGRDDLNVHSETGGSSFDAYHSMTVVTGSGDSRLEAELPRVPSRRRTDLDWLLEQAGPSFSTLYFNRRPGQLADIRAAIGSSISEDKLNAYEYRHTGWVETEDGEVAYLHNRGAIGADGAVDGLTAKLADGTFSKVVFPDPVEVDEITSVRAAIGALSYFNDPTVFYGLEGSCMATLSGMRLRGATAVIGRSKSGKTTIAAVSRSRMGNAFSREQMISAGSTWRSIADSGQGLHQGWLMVDDLWREGASDQARNEHSAAVDVITRRAYDGASSGRTVKAAGGDGRFVAQRPDGSAPGFTLMGEQIPVGTDSLPMSALERILVLRIDRDKTLVDTDGTSARALTDLAESGHMVASTACYLRYLAGEIEEVGGIEAWQRLLDQRFRDIQDELARTHPEVTETRFREPTAQTILGMLLWISFAIKVGAVTEDEGAEIMTDVYARLGAAMVAHVAVLTSTHDSILDRLRSLVASGRYVVVESDGTPPSIGKEVTPKKLEGVPHLALLPDEVARGLSMTASAVKTALAAVSVPGRDGPTWATSFNGKAVRTFLIPMDVWNLNAEEEDTTGEEF